MKQLVRNAKIIGTGSYTPDTVYTNEYLETIVPTSAQWVFEMLEFKKEELLHQIKLQVISHL